MRGFVRLVGEILLVRRIEPVVGYADMETASLVCQGKIELLGILRLRKSYASPGCEREAFVSNVGCRETAPKS